MRSTVVVGYDRSLPSGRALLEAGREAACRGADVVVVHAYWRPVTGAEELVRKAATETAEFGAAVLRRHHPELAIRSQTVGGAPEETLATAARSADLLVLGAGGGGVPEQELGSVAIRTLARTPRPTMVVRNPQRVPKGVVVAAMDIDHPVDAVLNFAFAEARLRSARLQVVSAYDLTEIRAALGDTEQTRDLCGGILAEAAAELDRIVKERQDRCAGVQAGGQVLDGPASAVLTAATGGADVIVSGARRLEGERWGTRVGPVTQILLRHAACPVVVVPHSTVPDR